MRLQYAAMIKSVLICSIVPFNHGCGDGEAPPDDPVESAAYVTVGDPPAGSTAEESGAVSRDAIDLPPAEAVISAYYEARGGKDALAAISSRVERGQVTVPAMSVSGSYIAYIQPPNQHNRTDFGTMGIVQNGITDGVTWTLNPVFGNSAEETGDTAYLDQVLGWEERFESVEGTGQEDIDGTTYYELTFVPAEGDSTTMLFDASTGLLYRVIAPGSSGQREIRTYSDYRDVDGILFPYGFTREGGVANVEITYDTIEFGSEIPDGQFALPDEVKGLL